jgi:hypothetical protein
MRKSFPLFRAVWRRQYGLTSRSRGTQSEASFWPCSPSPSSPRSASGAFRQSRQERLVKWSAQTANPRAQDKRLCGAARHFRRFAAFRRCLCEKLSSSSSFASLGMVTVRYPRAHKPPAIGRYLSELTDRYLAGRRRRDFSVSDPI